MITLIAGIVIGLVISGVLGFVIVIKMIGDFFDSWG